MRNETFVRSIGADEFIDYQAGPFEEAAHDMDVVFDTVGGDTFDRAFATLRKSGFLVTVVAFPKDEAERYGVKVARSSTTSNARNLAEIAKLVEAGKVKPHIETVFPLEEARNALALSEAGRARGKIVLSVAE